MAYFLKQSNKKEELIWLFMKVFYNPEKKETARKTYRSLGSVETLAKEDIKGSITFFQKKLTD